MNSRRARLLRQPRDIALDGRPICQCESKTKAFHRYDFIADEDVTNSRQAHPRRDRDKEQHRQTSEDHGGRARHEARSVRQADGCERYHAIVACMTLPNAVGGITIRLTGS